MRRFALALGISLLFPAAMLAAAFNASEATNQVGLDVFHTLRAAAAPTNLIVSPYSIESALILAYEGADGETRSEMSRVLHLPIDSAAVHPAFAEVRAGLAEMVRRSEQEAANAKRHGDGQDPIQWHVANRLFGERDYTFRDSFLALMRDGYNAPFQPMDFAHAPEPARVAINDWVAEQTNDKVRDLIVSGGVTSDTRLVLVNALYLKALWNSPFWPEATQPKPFHLLDGSAPEVPTMRKIEHYGYAHESRATVVTLPYVGNELQFVIILPDAGTGLDEALAQLSTDAFSRYAKLSAPQRKVDLSLPKFRIDSGSLALAKVLEQLGMRQAFDLPPHSANFDRMAPRTPDNYLLISQVFHRTFVAIDEKGTEAAAATAVTMMLGAAFRPEKPIEVRVDRPFLFAIQHRPTGVCLFLGQVTDPR